jgi:hypothetical protein
MKKNKDSEKLNKFCSDMLEELKKEEEDSITLVEEVEKMTKELHKLPYYKNKDNKLAKDMIRTILRYLDLEICGMVKVGESYDFDLCPKEY